MSATAGMECMEALAKAGGIFTEKCEGETFGIQWEDEPIYLISGFAVPREQWWLCLDFARRGDERSPGFQATP